ncbi:hypothetical protein M5C72_08810 [Companilactobacillus allii]|uniref:Glycosyl hydrolase family 8 n=1 Tax=Companilactobacillus allii TaxID=1847728 RepID=A0A1P8Q5S2_9LACO|nr:hypothetical protein [Companilactobacillus allii]APX73173.1 hypothetical protein BTM29_11700 [Companilactobacillus allii]USQ67980.1 hypothetical protein M5C72_08810 [Companilactobacillus allii]
MKKILILLMILPTIVLAGCSKKSDVKVSEPDMSTSNFLNSSNYGDYSTQNKLLYKFVTNKMLTKEGIYTNYKETKNQSNVATGHEMLSESSGLWLEYLVYTKQYKKFREFYKQTKNTFDQGDQFSYRYDPNTKKKSNVNATLDDLRIIRSLQMYAQATKSSKYKKEAATRFAKLKSGSIPNGKLVDFYDTKAKKSSSTGSLAYYDFKTLKYFESTSSKEKKYYKKQLKVVQNGYLGDAFPLYSSSYDWGQGSYSSKDLNTSEALETVLHLSEVGKVKKVTLNWLERQVKQRKLYNTYTINGSVVDKDQSTGSYALAAMIFANAKNEKMYKYTMKIMWSSQVTDDSSPIYGALGVKHLKQAYSFNNLYGLIASKY